MLTRLVTTTATADPATAQVVVSMMDAGVFGGRIRAAGVPLHCLRMRRGRPTLGGAWQLFHLLRCEKPDVLQTWLYHADLLGTLIAPLAGVRRTVWNIRCSEMRHRSRRTKTVVSVLAKISARVDAVIVNSAAGREAHERLRYRPPRWELIPNGFDLDKLRPDADVRASSRRLLAVDDANVVVGMVARVDPQKDHAVFLAAAAKVAAQNPLAVFALVGAGCEAHGPLRGLVREYGLQSRVRLLGQRDDIAQILPGFDLCALSSAYGEGFPNVIAESMASGVAVVATDVGDTRRIVGETGLIVPPRAPTALAGALNRMIDHGTAGRWKLGRAARARIAERYALADVCARYAGFYHSLLRE